jgi:hypothetical protein
MIIVEKASVWTNERPVEEARQRIFDLPECDLKTTCWCVDMTVEEAIHKYGTCVVSYIEGFDRFKVLIYDDYIE